ncbi:hypothetical protein K458DRAFT_159564 [Lentithecium fluviatile CBS 122367]|uniref:Uncharacterized protein n=1 Tax=Lentithecium fluviatile CBS 122367 TaxID=1168545 RepID=A0A6G1IHN2_9PLEO|nr:hypothetical protein K458DRAFT_159564 [Lentithecium fluviatile CBS 122367]
MKILPLLLLPLALAVPAPHHRGGRPGRPEHHPDHHDHPDIKFTLHDIAYQSHMIYSTPSHLAVHYATLDFNLTDTRGYKASCSAYDSSGIFNFFNYPQTFNCTKTSEHVGGDATFSYLGYNQNLQVNETFSVRGRNYLAVSDVIDLKAKGFQCESTNWQNPNWTWPNPSGNYQTYDTVCKPITLDTTPKVQKL